MTGTEPLWIEEIDALSLHDRLLVLHGGPAGLRDQGLLQSALARPRQPAAYGQQSDLIDLASAYTVGIVKNHPFSTATSERGSSSASCSWH